MDDRWSSLRQNRESDFLRSEGQWAREKPELIRGITFRIALRHLFLEAPVKWVKLQFPLVQSVPDSSRYMHITAYKIALTPGNKVKVRPKRVKMSYPLLLGSRRVSWAAVSWIFGLILLLIFILRVII